MNIGFKELDKLIDINEPQLILLVDKWLGRFAAELSGDIANNICLKQELPVLELVDCAKEYVIKRLVINQCDVDYRNWYSKKYSDEEFIKIAKSTIEMIETTKKLPTIIENHHSSIKQIKNIIKEFTNEAGIYDCGRQGLVVLDIFTFKCDNKYKEIIKRCWNKKEYVRCINQIKWYLFRIIERKKYITELKRMSKRYNVPIVVTYILRDSSYNETIKLEDIKEKFILKKADTIILMNHNKDDILKYELDVCSKGNNNKCNLKYLPEYRKFVDFIDKEK